MNPQIKQAKLEDRAQRLVDHCFARGMTVSKATYDFFLTELSQAKLETLEAIIKEVEGMKHLELSRGGDRSEDQCENDAFDQVLSTLQAEKELLEKEI